MDPNDRVCAALKSNVDHREFMQRRLTTAIDGSVAWSFRLFVRLSITLIHYAQTVVRNNVPFSRFVYPRVPQ